MAQSTLLFVKVIKWNNIINEYCSDLTKHLLTIYLSDKTSDFYIDKWKWRLCLPDVNCCSQIDILVLFFL